MENSSNYKPVITYFSKKIVTKLGNGMFHKFIPTKLRSHFQDTVYKLKLQIDSTNYNTEKYQNCNSAVAPANHQTQRYGYIW